MIQSNLNSKYLCTQDGSDVSRTACLVTSVNISNHGFGSYFYNNLNNKPSIQLTEQERVYILSEFSYLSRTTTLSVRKKCQTIINSWKDHLKGVIPRDLRGS